MLRDLEGFIDLLSAFERLSHPNKKLILIGSLTSEAKQLLSRTDLTHIQILGCVPNAQPRQHYSKASVFVLPSIEEGLSMVIGEAIACGCPVIVSTNTGATELITDGVEGFIVPIRSSDVIVDHMQQLADQPELLKRWVALLGSRKTAQGLGYIWRMEINYRVLPIDSFCIFYQKFECLSNV